MNHPLDPDFLDLMNTHGWCLDPTWSSAPVIKFTRRAGEGTTKKALMLDLLHLAGVPTAFTYCHRTILIRTTPL